MTKPIVWTIAGSDSGGGAGLQADLHTFADLGCHGCSVVTSVTAQSSVEVTAVERVSDSVFQAQLDTLWRDLPAVAIKVGLLADDAQIELLARWLKARQIRVPVILDPVLVASSGARLSGKEGAEPRFDPLLPLVALVTPNGDELAALTGQPIHRATDVTQASRNLLARGAKAVLAKGGHFDQFEGRCVDLYLSEQQYFLLDGPRIETDNTHGSGCTLSSALAAFLARGYEMHDALVLTRAYLHSGLVQSQQLGQGPGPLARTGWPNSFEAFPSVPLPGSAMEKEFGFEGPYAEPIVPFAPCDTQELGLYPVVDSLEWLERLLAQGVRTLQLRIKDLSQDEADPLVAKAAAMGRRCGARLFINDYWQLAVKHGAYGVHLGQEDMVEADLAAITGAGLRLGLSTHGYFEILRAAALHPSYIALGHIFPTTTKEMPSQPQGLERLQRYHQLLAGRWPTVAIGGIDHQRAPQVAATGVGSIAVVRAVTQAPDLTRSLEQLWSAYESGQQAREASYAV
ncbi:thiamine phosphate synthase [Ferrimonas sp. YFM]|uniref:thiamine phosphate synthase n=1 Tax=Ferrimonas sp. YFM TaxID=3028878 RepID=UPI0025725036|nr:thiamine phosphate synthase [Ferrimonas sp. YFM]BDY04818.1 bifunctional hydroxymethylpyrimidine kinase/phosphomethylpyrimidine kinase [Ferrimonas sp. YFM]